MSDLLWRSPLSSSASGSSDSLWSTCGADHLHSPISFAMNTIIRLCLKKARITIGVNESCKVTLPLFAGSRIKPPARDAQLFISVSSERNREWGAVCTGMFITLSLPEKLKHNLSGHY